MLLTVPWTSSSSSVRSMTEPLGLPAGAATLEEVDPPAWLSNEKDAKNSVRKVHTVILLTLGTNYVRVGVALFTQDQYVLGTSNNL